VNGTELRIQTDAGEDVVVQQDPTNLLNVEVTIDGTPSPAVGVLAASSLTQLTIITGDEANTVDIRGVDENIFTGLTGPTAVSISMGNGDDTFLGSNNVEATVDAGDGNDTVTSFDAADTILGGDGDDVILGGGGNDSIDAGDGTDVVDGEAGNDTITGGDGPDIINGGLGLDSILGGDGDDVLSGDAGMDFIQGDLGSDVINGGLEDDVLFGGGGVDQINGDEGNDQIFGNSGDDVLNGGIGDDLINAGNGDDSVLGGDGNEFVQGGSGNDTIDGEAGDDVIRAGSGDDLVYGDGLDPGTLTFGNDVILGESGNDTLIGTAGADTITGGTGDDLIQSTITGDAATPPPPPVPSPPPPPPPSSGFPIEDLTNAVSTGGGAALGTSTSLTLGTGDNSLVLTGLTAAGDFTTSVFDPLGTTYGATNNLLFTQINVRNDTMGTRFGQLNSGGAALTGSSTEARGSFVDFGVTWDGVHQLSSLEDGAGQSIGVLLTSTFTMTNSSAAPVTLDLVRYIDYHMFRYQNVSNDGGGQFFDSQGTRVLFESTNTVMPGIEVAFAGITGEGGMPLTTDRYHLADLFIVDPNGPPLPNLIEGDTDGDDIVDNPSRDNREAIRNLFVIPPGGSDTYTTHSTFGVFIPLPINVPPTAVDDPGNMTFSTNPVTIDVVSNDTDPDGVLDFSTVAVNQPANGTVVSLGNGLVTYTANPGFAGTDAFTYTIQDNSGDTSNLATVTVTVAGGDEAGDLLNGGLGEDTIIGAAGDDTIIGDHGADSLLGGDGNDSMLGAAGNDTMDGQNGNDTLFGQGGQDVVIGGANEDTLVWRSASDGTDTFFGGTGGDIAEIRGDATDNNFTIGQTAEGRLTVAEGFAGLTLDFDISEIIVNGNDGNDVIALTSVSDVVLSRLTINGGNGNDAINSSNGEVSSLRIEMNGDIGNDTLTGGASGETLSGGDGDDLIMSGGGNDVITGDDGADTINGEDGNDTVDGGLGNDTILGGNGNDSLSGGDDNDTIDGEADNDTIDGGSGDDVLVGSFGNDSVSGGLGIDALIGGSGDDFLDGGRNNDFINGNSGNDTILGGDGDDFIRGNNGSDEILAGDGADTVFGGDGADGIDGGDGDDLLFGDNGSDVVVGGDGDDSIHGGGAQDVILGQEGDDTLVGAGGTDIIAGGQGTNTFDALETAEINELFVLTPELLDRLDGM
jgi:Ca2+-binding RTX toxin-like protein